jgi:hypothetical protein
MRPHATSSRADTCAAEAKAQYARMARLENDALQLSKGAGCASCIMGTAAATSGSAAAGTEPQPELYARLHRPGSSWQAAYPPGGAAMRRAEGAVHGAAVGDAAAMGVQWIYDLDVLKQLAEARLQQVCLAGARLSWHLWSQHCRHDLSCTCPCAAHTPCSLVELTGAWPSTSPPRAPSCKATPQVGSPASRHSTQQHRSGALSAATSMLSTAA